MAKVKFDAGAMKQFFARNVEKLLFLVVVFVFLFFVYGAIGRDRLEFTPEELSADAQRAKENLEKSEPTGIVEGLVLTNYLDRAKGIRQAIEDKFYQHATLWNRPDFERPGGVRTSPPLLPVRALRGSPGYGGFGVGAAGMGAEYGMASDPMMSGMMPGMPGGGTPAKEEPKGRRWVLLTGIIDVAKQIQAYKEALSGALVPGRTTNVGMAGGGMDPMMSAGSEYGMSGGQMSPDDPNWFYFKVERAEISGTGQANVQWQPINVRLQWSTLQKLGASMQSGMGAPGMEYGGSMGGSVGGDVVEPMYMIRNQAPIAMATGGQAMPIAMAFPLPNPQGYQWGAEAACPPEIPVRPKQIGPAIGPDGMPIAGPVGPDGQPVNPNEPPPDDPLAQPRIGMPGMDPGMGSEMMDPMMYQSQPGMSGVPGMAVKKADVGLFRFFDFTVEPGKHYRYRVRLMLANPNYGLSPRYLETEELAKDQLLESDWSDPTDIISVPRDSRLLAGPVKSSRYATIEPSTTMMVIHFDEMSGRETSVEKNDVLRGQLANYTEEIEKPTAPAMMPGMMEGSIDPAMMGSADAMYGPPQPRQRRREPKKDDGPKETINYRTGQVVLDLSGGDNLPGRDRDLTEPGKLLLLDADGNLVVRNELLDMEEYKRYDKPEEKKKPEMMMPEGMMPPGMEGSMDPAMMMEAPRGRRPRRGGGGSSGP